jgi:cobyrinic acid a,c-diamide synthase
MITCPRLVVAGLGGDTGKTAVSVGLCRLWHEKGYRVTPFKKGPDYIDMEWLSRGAFHSCYNVDLFLMNEDQVLSSFCMNSRNTDISVIEGNRGLYDGMDVEGNVSTAEIAKLLKSPVVLVVDCTKVTRTVAALVMGCQTMDPEVSIKGVILNKLAGSRHESTVRKSVEYYCNVPVVGAIPKLKNIKFPGRHLGLVPPQEHPMAEESIDKTAEVMAKYLDIEQLWQKAHQAPPIEVSSKIENPPSPPFTKGGMGGLMRIGIIRDSAFQFYYQENLDALRRAGAQLIEFSALTDSLPPSLDALYIGGGFPETHAPVLSGNVELRHAIKDAVESGLPTYAECGGLMYLSRELVWDGKTYPMVGVLPADVGVSKKTRGHGYTMLEVTGQNPFFATGTILRGHEFHYSYIRSMNKTDQYSFVFNVMKGEGITNGMEGVCYRNVLATYTHLHAMGTPEWVQGMIKAAGAYKTNLLAN